MKMLMDVGEEKQRQKGEDLGMVNLLSPCITIYEGKEHNRPSREVKVEDEEVR